MDGRGAQDVIDCGFEENGEGVGAAKDLWWGVSRGVEGKMLEFEFGWRYLRL